LHYAVSQSGRYDDFDRRAVLAYRKGQRDDRIQAVNRQDPSSGWSRRRHLQAEVPVAGPPRSRPTSRARSSSAGRRDAYRIYHMSSGKPSTRRPRHLPGLLEDARGEREVDVRRELLHPRLRDHGYRTCLAYAASHGCLRIPNADAPSVFAWVHIGTTVDVYR